MPGDIRVKMASVRRIHWKTTHHLTSMSHSHLSHTRHGSKAHTLPISNYLISRTLLSSLGWKHSYGLQGFLVSSKWSKIWQKSSIICTRKSVRSLSGFFNIHRFQFLYICFTNILSYFQDNDCYQNADTHMNVAMINPSRYSKGCFFQLGIAFCVKLTLGNFVN